MMEYSSSYSMRTGTTVRINNLSIFKELKYNDFNTLIQKIDKLSLISIEMFQHLIETKLIQLLKLHLLKVHLHC
jgi:hypothetical protein